MIKLILSQGNSIWIVFFIPIPMQKSHNPIQFSELTCGLPQHSLHGTSSEFFRPGLRVFLPGL